MTKRSVRKQTRGINNRLFVHDADCERVTIDIVGDNNTVSFARGCFLRCLAIQIRGNCHSVSIGKSVRVNGTSVIWLEDDSCRVTVGGGTTFESVHLAAVESGSEIEIGKDCMFANGIDVRTSDSHSILDPRTGKRLNPAASVKIGDHVWVGAHSSILKGVTIGNGSVVGSRAVVTKSFHEEHCLILGSPAQQNNRRVAWCRERL